MNPSVYVIDYLTQTQFIRNIPLDDLLSRMKNNMIPLAEYLCYSVVIVDGHRLVNILRFLKQTPPNGVLSFYIQWYMVKNYLSDEYLQDAQNIEFEDISFWVHSGVALRKKFFYAEDRMSFLRSTFMYDHESDSLYRLSCIWPWVSLQIEIPFGCAIFNQPGISYRYTKKTNKINPHKNDRKENELKKHCKRLLKSHNYYSYLEKKYPILYKELIRIIEDHGHTPSSKHI